MQQEERIALLKNVMLGMSKLMGEDTEIVIHDLYKKEMVYISNSHLTERTVGYKMDPTVYEAISNLADEDGHLIGYGSNTAHGQTLRSSHIIVRDDEGVPAVMICINQDTSRLREARDLLDSMIQLKPLLENSEEDESEEVLGDENYIQKVTQHVILDSIEKMKPTPMDTKEGKMQVLQQLELKGVFAVKDAVPSVCKLLSISQATLYNYLREIRNQDLLIGQTPVHR